MMLILYTRVVNKVCYATRDKLNHTSRVWFSNYSVLVGLELSKGQDTSTFHIKYLKVLLYLKAQYLKYKIQCNYKPKQVNRSVRTYECIGSIGVLNSQTLVEFSQAI